MKVKMLNKAFGYDQDERGANKPGKWFEKGEYYEMSECLAKCFISTKDAKLEDEKAYSEPSAEPKKAAKMESEKPSKKKKASKKVSTKK